MSLTYKSGSRGSASSGGTTSEGSIAQRPQYKTLMRTSKGAEQTESMLFNSNKRRLSVRSARSPTANVAVAMARPMMVRNW